jgi:undecaprenyl-diphosphatase
VSSTAHLMIFSKLLGVGDSEFLKTFEIVVQLGAIFAVLFLYFKKIFSDFSLIKNIVVGFLPTGLAGFLLYKVFKSFLSNVWLALAMMFLGGIVLVVFEKFFSANGGSAPGGKAKDGSTSPRSNAAGTFDVPLTTSEQLDLKKSLMIGLWQCLALVPGVSRSMATIFGGMVSGLSRKSAVEFSFLLALPTMFSATAYDIYKNYSLFSFGDWQTLAIGFVVAFLSALISVKWFLNFVGKNSFSNFGWYRIVFAVAVLLILF